MELGALPFQLLLGLANKKIELLSNQKLFMTPAGFEIQTPSVSSETISSQI